MRSCDEHLYVIFYTQYKIPSVINLLVRYIQICYNFMITLLHIYCIKRKTTGPKIWWSGIRNWERNLKHEESGKTTEEILPLICVEPHLLVFITSTCRDMNRGSEVLETSIIIRICKNHSVCSRKGSRLDMNPLEIDHFIPTTYYYLDS